jgi:pyrroloquinoline quinone biosynthesis protein D
MIEPETRLRQREGLLSQRAADTRILLDPKDGRYYALDEVSGRIWDLCDGTRTVAQVVATLCGEYEAPAETVEADVLEFLGDLANDGLIVPLP